MGPARAKGILFPARRLAAHEALATGLIDRIEGDEGPFAQDRSHTEALAGSSPALLAATRAIVDGLSPAADDPRLQTIYAEDFAGPDFAEGGRAAVERRTPGSAPPRIDAAASSCRITLHRYGAD